MTKKDLGKAICAGIAGGVIASVVMIPFAIGMAADAIVASNDRIADELYSLRHTTYKTTYHNPIPVKLFNDKTTTEE